MELRKRGKIYYAEFYKNGVRVRQTTHCTDQRAAEALGLRWEREASDPASERARNTTLKEALDLLIDQRHELAVAGQRSPDTVAFYARKSGVLLRVFARVLDERPEAIPLPRIDASTVDAYVSHRRAEWADDKKTHRISDHTIVKELTTLRAALKLAKRRGLWKGDLDELMPVAGEVSAKYKPKERWLTQVELMDLARAIGGRSAHSMFRKDRMARIAYSAATGAEKGALDRAERADAVLGDPIDHVLVRGTKRPSRWRTVPVVPRGARNMLRFAIANAEGQGAMLFRPWANPDRDIKNACRRAGIEPCSYNDLRRTFAQWLRQAGVALELISPAMGHVTTTMVQRVYGKLDAAALGVRIASQLGGPPVDQPADPERNLRDGGDAMEAKNSGDLCRREELNFGPWDYDSSIRFLESSIAARPKGKRVGESGPPVDQSLRTVPTKGRSR